MLNITRALWFYGVVEAMRLGWTMGWEVYWFTFS